MAVNETATTRAISRQTFVALDLETTGLDHDRDSIIEVGAVKFRGQEVIDTFQTFVNPNRPIPEFVQRLTGIAPRQVARAPRFNAVADRLGAFVAGHPVVGHNIAFDLRFLGTHGLTLPNPSYDTWDLASVFLPTTPEYSLGYLANLLQVEHANPHRALEDAQATREVFIGLLHRAGQADPGLLDFINTLAGSSRWGLGSLLAEARDEDRLGKVSGMTGLDQEHLAECLARPQRRRPAVRHDDAEGRVDTETGGTDSIDPAEILGMLEPGGAFARTFPGFEYRPEQAQMLSQVSEAIFQGNHLVVEGGTGVGKSMAYLLPTAIFAATQGQRVVISTNTINLQEQLVHKDIPAVIEVLKEAGLIEEGQIQAALLKGRGNYLCLNRWSNLSRGGGLTVDEARLLGKTAVWLQHTESGDRAEVNLPGRDSFNWNRVSAGDRRGCLTLRNGGPCFYRNARDRAEQADIVVVNHSLLLVDLVRGGGLIPEYQRLVVDEAHNLEEEATRQLGFEILQDQLAEKLEPLARLVSDAQAVLTQPVVAAPVRQEGTEVAGELATMPADLAALWDRLWTAAGVFLNDQRGGDYGQLLITPPMRRHQSWKDLALEWENVDVSLGRAVNRLSHLQNMVERANSPSGGQSDGDDNPFNLEAAAVQEDLNGLREQLSAVIGAPADGSIIWIARDQSKDELSLHFAPLGVNEFLADRLFGQTKSVVLTSATLSTQGQGSSSRAAGRTGPDCSYLRQRLGIDDETPELLVGSPFDYQRAALLMIPEDMPQPNADRYIESVSRVVTDLGRSLEGRTMALFTSHAALRAVAHQVRERLMEQGVHVLAQGVDGSPRQLTQRFIGNPKSVLLGTSSFWEGVDLPDGILKALVLTRLPFQVPSDPIVKARSEQYDDAFNQYSVPQAVLRFRQGTGRLIRRKTDRGAIVVLDRRITGRNYGHAFIQSIPPCSMKPCNLATVGDLVAEWVG